MEKITATFRIVTPMFIAGANQQQAELRAPSIKGALRFWWRALNWDRIQTGKNRKTALEDLYKEESWLFGDAGKNGQSRFLLKLSKPITGNLSGDSLLNSDLPRKYLGYGLFAMGEIPQRFAIPANKEFTLEVLLKNGMGEEQKFQLESSIRALGLLGGLGSRVRRGFGSIAISSLGNENFVFDSLESYEKTIAKLLNTRYLSTEELPFTAINNKSRITFGIEEKTPENAHRYIGRVFKRFRTERQHEPRKKFFGLPLDGYDKKKRRASPLMFHIHPVGKRFVPLLLYIPSEFHPELKSDFSLVEEFFDQFEKEGAA